MVTLDGSGSTDADSDPLTYHWTQVAGPTATLSFTNPAKPTFTAPLVNADAVLTFQLVVDDGKVFSTPSTVDITVHDLPVDMAMGPDMAQGPDMTTPPPPADMAQAPADLAQGGTDDMYTTTPPPDMAKGGGHGGCSATGTSNAPAPAMPLVGLALLGFVLRRRSRRA
jgi:uncharacterized protein (TIGR03382 family)